MSKNKTSSDFQKLLKSASQARDHAYARYSGYKVGAAIRTKDGQIFAGCNVENSSYGATVCAERVAIQSAIANRGKFELAEVLVFTEASPPWPPCGMCRQVIAEFAVKDLIIHSVNPSGETRTVTFDELFPNAFTPDHIDCDPS